MKSFTVEQITEIRRRYAKGESSYKLADEYYMSQKGLYAYVSDIKRPMPSHRAQTDKRIQQMRQGYIGGATIYEIADNLGISANCVYTYVKDLVKRKRQDNKAIREYKGRYVGSWGNGLYV